MHTTSPIPALTVEIKVGFPCEDAYSDASSSSSKQVIAFDQDFVPSSVDLLPEVASIMYANGFTSLYSHQAQAINLIRKGANIVLATSTSSGLSPSHSLSLCPLSSFSLFLLFSFFFFLFFFPRVSAKKKKMGLFFALSQAKPGVPSLAVYKPINLDQVAVSLYYYFLNRLHWTSAPPHRFGPSRVGVRGAIMPRWVPYFAKTQVICNQAPSSKAQPPSETTEKQTARQPDHTPPRANAAPLPRPPPPALRGRAGATRCRTRGGCTARARRCGESTGPALRTPAA